MSYLGRPRFVVCETEGLNLPSVGPVVPGLSVMVLDRAYCCAVVQSWKSEDYHLGGRPPNNVSGVMVRERIRREAAERCAELNAK